MNTRPHSRMLRRAPATTLLTTIITTTCLLAACQTVSLDDPNWSTPRTTPHGHTNTPAPVEHRHIGPPLPEATPHAVPNAAAPTAPSSTPWAGHYEGTFPCADCEGIRAILTLNPNNTYMLSLSYQGTHNPPIIKKGQFTWNADETEIILDAQGSMRRYRLEPPHTLRMLHRDGRAITGVFANNYVLKKR